MRKHNRSFLLGCLLLVMGLGLCSCEGTNNVIPGPGNTVPSGDNPNEEPDDTGDEDPTTETEPGEVIPDDGDGDDTGATPTPDPDPVTYTIAFSEEEYEFEIDETLDLNGAVTCEASDGSTATYTLSVDNSIFVIENHVVTATKAGGGMLTAICDQDKTIQAEATITATDVPAPEPETDLTYKIGAYNTTAGCYYYLTGNNDGSYAGATTSWDNAADFTVEESGSGYTLSTVQNGTTYYVSYTGTGSNSNLSVRATTPYVWYHNTAYDTYTTANNSGRVICNRANYTDIRCYAYSNLSGNNTEYYPCHLYESGTTTVEPDDPGDTGGSGDKTYTQTFTLDSNRTLPSDISSYSTGGFATTTYSNYGFDIYKGVSASGGFVKILSEITNTNTTSSLPGMLSNTTGFPNIVKFELTYKTSNNSYAQNKSEVPHLYYGNTNSYGYTYDLSTSSSNKTVTIDTEGTNIQFFCLSTSYYDVTISSLTIYYNSGTASSFAESSCGDGQYRIEPVRYTGSTLVANSTSVSVPIDVTYNTNGTYTINKTKTLTYDTYDSAYSAKRTTNAYTDPADVAAYFIAFGTYPCNYVETDDYATAYKVFGSSTRFWSKYTRTNGYATSVPYRNDTGKTYPTYYELDIALTSNYTKSSTSYSRGVGRLVCWTNGFTGYDTYPVVTYTDDHYHTFKEYYNDGTFGLNFNAEGKATRYVHGYPTTAKAS